MLHVNLYILPTSFAPFPHSKTVKCNVKESLPACPAILLSCFKWMECWRSTVQLLKYIKVITSELWRVRVGLCQDIHRGYPLRLKDTKLRLYPLWYPHSWDASCPIRNELIDSPTSCIIQSHPGQRRLWHELWPRQVRFYRPDVWLKESISLFSPPPVLKMFCQMLFSLS